MDCITIQLSVVFISLTFQYILSLLLMVTIKWLLTMWPFRSGQEQSSSHMSDRLSFIVDVNQIA